MKKLGLIGGVGPEATIPYYQGIVYGVQKRVGKPFFPNLTIESLSSFEVMRLSAAGELKELEDYLMKGIENLAAAGADFAALGCNTGHIVFDELSAKSPIPLISMIEVVSAEAKKSGYTKIGVLGTTVTMEGEFFRRPFENKQIEVVAPNKEAMAYINDKIDKELEYGIVKEETKEKFFEIVRRMKEEDKIQAVVLGCTEIPLLFKDAEEIVPCLDTVEIHIQALVDEIMAG